MVEDCVAALWQERSLRVKRPTVRNSLRAVFGPTLRHLQLIRGEGDKLILMPAGKKLLQVYETEGEAGFRAAFAKHFVRLDNDNGMSVLFKVEALGGSVAIEVLLAQLGTAQPESSLTEDRLRKFLLYCSYLDLVKLENGKVELRQAHFRNILRGTDVRIPDDQFLEVLTQEYEKLRVGIHGSPYIAIPGLRDAVCEVTGISPDYFDKKLVEVPKETPEYLIHLTEPMQRKSGGLRLGGRYLYYAAIYKKQREAQNEQI